MNNDYEKIRSVLQDALSDAMSKSNTIEPEEISEAISALNNVELKSDSILLKIISLKDEWNKEIDGFENLIDFCSKKNMKLESILLLEKRELLMRKQFEIREIVEEA